MKSIQIQRILASLAVILSSSQVIQANPVSRDLVSALGPVGVVKRCAIPCGYSGQLCCNTGQMCFVDSNNQAQCGVGVSISAGGGYASYSQAAATGVSAQAAPTSSYAAAQSTPAAITCQGSGQTPCGTICCASNQFCVISGQCEAIKGGSSFNSAGYTTYSTFGAPVRPTTGSATTVTGGPRSTVPFQTPVGTAGGINYGASASQSNGLSGGAIAGIVIGVIAGIILLILLCAACCLGAGLQGVKNFFGLGRRRRTTETRIEERYSHHGGSGGHSGWFGRRPSRYEKPPKKSSGLGGLGAMTAGLAGLAIALGLKRRHDRKDSSTGSSYSYDTSYYDTSQSSSSSDRRTRTTRESIRDSRRSRR